jgi:hypothetical protein
MMEGIGETGLWGKEIGFGNRRGQVVLAGFGQIGSMFLSAIPCGEIQAFYDACVAIWPVVRKPAAAINSK